MSEKRPASYHHGDLHGALLRASRRLLEEQGLAGLTLRAAARSAGVSHAAPQHHFGDLSGLLSELAAVGFLEFGDQLEAAVQGQSGAQRLRAMGQAYVAFAATQPAMFQVMFRSERLNHERPALSAAIQRVRLLLGAATDAGMAADSTPATCTPAQRGRILKAWSMAHGFSMLLLDGRLSPHLAGVAGGDWQVLLAEVFDSALEGDDAGALDRVAAGEGAVVQALNPPAVPQAQPLSSVAAVAAIPSVQPLPADLVREHSRATPFDGLASRGFATVDPARRSVTETAEAGADLEAVELDEASNEADVSYGSSADGQRDSGHAVYRSAVLRPS